MGRPKKEIDAETVTNLAKIGCTYSEIAAVVGCSKSTLSDRFRTEIDKGHEELKKSIRRMQLQAANKGNVAMLIWLGKQYLGQRDKSEVSVGAADLYTDPIDQVPAVRDRMQKAAASGNGHKGNGKNGNGKQ